MPKKLKLDRYEVLDEVIRLRGKIRAYFTMTDDQLRKELQLVVLPPQTREFMIERLVMAATYHLTNVLDIE